MKLSGVLSLLTAVALALVLLPQGTAAVDPPSLGDQSFDSTDFVRVIDGDSLEMWRTPTRWGIGVVGIQTPMGNTPCGESATGRMWELTSGTVHFEAEAGVLLDERGRRMYNAFAADGTSIAKTLVSEGWVRASRKPSSVRNELVKAEIEAKLADRGCLWSGAKGPRGVKRERPVKTPKIVSGLSSAVAAMDNPDPKDPVTIGDGASANAISVAGYQDLLVSSGFNTPTTFEMLPDGRVLVAEKDGILKIWSAGTTSTVIDISSQVNDYWDHGLLGLTSDPNFASNGYIYLLFTYENNAAAYSGTKTARVIRLTMTGNTASIGTAVTILGTVVGATCNGLPAQADCIPSESPSHSIGTAKFGPDGKLWVTTGDGGHFNGVNDDSVRPQNVNLLSGKVLRVNPDGTGVPDNPFFDGNPLNARSKVYALGLRNSFRINFNPTTGRLYFGDVGWNAVEEINVVRPGANFGWPCYEGSSQQSGYQNYSACQTLYAQGAAGHTRPIYEWNHCCGSSAAVGGAFTTSYPGAQQNAYFFGDYAQEWIRYMKTDANDAIVGSVQNFATSTNGPVSIQRGVNGDIYYLAINTGHVRRIQSSTGNQQPVAVMSATPTNGLAPLSVAFSAAGSSDPDNDPLTYNWAFGDGATATGLTTSHTYTTNAVRTATLTVTDGRGGTDPATTAITVGNRAPTITITSPLANAQYKVGDRIDLVATGTDLDDGGALPPASLGWSIILHHGNHQHFFLTLSGASTFFDIPDHGDDTHFEIVATGTDSGGLAGEARVNVYPQPVQLTLNSSPQGLPLVYDGTLVTAPYTTTTVANSTHNLLATSPAGQYGFVSWSDGGAQQHNVTLGTAPTASFTANFQAAVSFDDLPNPNRALNGQYPTNIADWGTGKWYLSAPFAGNPANSISFSTAVVTSQTFSWVAPRRLVSVMAYNGGGSTSVSLACAGNTTKTQTVAAGATVNILTGWLNTCTTITVSSSNGWDTNFDDFMYESASVNDTTPPQFSAIAGAPTSGTAATVTWITNELSTSQVEFGTTASYGSFAPAAADPALVTSHGVPLTGLTPNTTYFFRVRSTDASGNPGISTGSTFATPPVDGTPPVISNIAAGSVTTSGATISWSTDEPANTQAEYGLTSSYGTFAPPVPNPALTLGHTQAISGLLASTTYFYRVRSADGSGNVTLQAGGTFTTASAPLVTEANFDDLTNPNRTLTGQYPTGVIDWGTNKWYLSSPFSAFTTNSVSFLTSGVTSQTFAFVQPKRLVSVQAVNAGGGNATVTIACAGNTTKSQVITVGSVQTISTNFTTACTTVTVTSSNGWDTNFDKLIFDSGAPADSTPPVISNVVASNVAANSATITWTTNEASNEQAEYGVTVAYGSLAPASPGAATNLSHTVNLSGLLPSTTYNYRAVSRDASTNTGVSPNLTFTTSAAPPDGTPPVISNVTSSGITATGAIIGWTTNENANEQVQFGLTASYGTLVPASPGPAVNLTHAVPLSGLAPSTTYNYRVISRDAATNTATSANLTFTTSAPAPANSALDFDGSDDIATAADSASLDLAGPLTIEAWVKLDAAPANKFQTIVFKRSATNGNNLAYALYHYNGVYFEMRSGTQNYSLGDNLPLQTGVWHHVAVSYDRVMLRIFVDGQQTANVPLTVAVTATNGAVSIGANLVWTDEQLNGAIDEVRLSKIARYSAPFTPPGAFTSDANTVALWHFDEATGQTIADASGSNNVLTRGTSASAESRDPAWIAGSPFLAGAALFAPSLNGALPGTSGIAAPGKHQKGAKRASQ